MLTRRAVIIRRFKMAGLKTVYGKESRVFEITLTLDSNYEYVQLMNPLRKSIREYLHDCSGGLEPAHVHLVPQEGAIFMNTLWGIVKYSVGQERRRIRIVHLKTLQEQGIDVISELRQASFKPSDDEARMYLRQFNLKLRQHLENFPTHYNNPKRLPGQGGKLRKPLNIPPIHVKWP